MKLAPAGLLKGLTPADLGHASIRRNPLIADGGGSRGSGVLPHGESR